MADTPMPAVSPFQALVPGMENMVAALNKPKPVAADPGTYEGNIASPANPLNAGTYGQPTPSPGMPPPQTGGAPPAQPSGAMPMNPFTQGAHPTPFLNGSALFGRPPMTGAPSPFGASAQRPNPLSQMQL